MSDEGYSVPVRLFIERLDGLDAGDRARFRRCAGRTLAEAGEALGLFYRLLPTGVPDREEDLYFLVATLYPMADGGGAGNLGASLRRTRSRDNSAGLDRRVEILLDADLPRLPFRLRQAVHLLHSHRVAANWYQLLADVRHWSHPNRFVQREWAKSYFRERSDQYK